ncbi:hypothetical protein M569_14441 [Genlisea aurea]|uniref:UspA domain-containing protein n=1 Tax=Genlisea aurea TaxID=192259 RepID=S8C7N9_9LAMI|nr:hypothetical protein M569_14441 [Genlisea aurea]
MTNGKRVIVAVDESEESMFALSWCLTDFLAGNLHPYATLILLYVKPPPPAYSSIDVAGQLFSGDVLATMEKHGRDLTESVMNRAAEVHRISENNCVKVEKKVGSGVAEDVICNAVDELQADVLVMGTHDYGFLKRAILGSVSDYCAKHANCPVVVVKRPVPRHSR